MYLSNFYSPGAFVIYNGVFFQLHIENKVKNYEMSLEGL
jgi:hypothetical protein